MDLHLKTGNNIIDNYNKQLVSLIEEFTKIYFTDEEGNPSEWYMIGANGWVGPGTVGICDMYIDPSTMWECLYHNIPPEVFTKWYWGNQDSYENNEEYFPNLVSYYKGAPVYTKEDKERDEKKISETYKILEEEILKHNQKEIGK